MSTVTEETPEITEPKTNKWVYLFDEGPGDDKALLGGKGAGLCEMTQTGLPVPPGFDSHHRSLQRLLRQRQKLSRRHVGTGEGRLEAGSRRRSASVSAIRRTRCSSRFAQARRFSMPGMMDTVLNLGLNEETVQGLAEQTGDLRFALDAYRRFASLFGEIVMGVAHEKFERVLDRFKAQHKADATPISKPITCARSSPPRNRSFSPSNPRFRRSIRTTPRRDRGGLQLVDGPARDRLPSRQSHTRFARHRSQRAGDGFRKHGRGQRHRRGVHAQSFNRQERTLRRVSAERAGRRRRRRNSHAESD